MSQVQILQCPFHSCNTPLLLTDANAGRSALNGISRATAIVDERLDVYYGPMQSATSTTETCTVTTLTGLEPVLVQEIESLGIRDVVSGSRAVSFSGTRRDTFRCLHLLRTALRVLVRIDEFEANNPDELYQHVSRIEWRRYLSTGMTFAVDCTSASQVFRHSGFAALRVKDAIVDQFRKQSGQRPSVRPERPDLRVNLHINGTHCVLSRDAAGESLHKRGYRTQAGEAPLTETLASGMVQLAGWTPQTLVIDPFCGSGTIVIEAALIAAGIPPGTLRQKFGMTYGCETWLDFDSSLWKSVCSSKQASTPGPGPVGIGFDVSRKMVDLSRENAQRAGVADLVVFDLADVRTFSSTRDGGGIVAKAVAENRPRMVVANPPYGERLKGDDVGDLYRATGDTLKHQFPGADAWILSGNFAALKRVGLRSERRIPLMNGPIECRFVHYHLRAAAETKEGSTP